MQLPSDVDVEAIVSRTLATSRKASSRSKGTSTEAFGMDAFGGMRGKSNFSLTSLTDARDR